MTRALVLGGGGPVGIAWQIGLLAGLAEAGVDLSQADRTIGTSAGSVVGAVLGSGRPAEAIYADHMALATRTAKASAAAPAADLSALVEFMMRRPVEGPPSDGLMAEMGAHALRSPTMSEADYLAMMGRLFRLGDAWPSGFVCTAADAETGAFKVWDAAARVDPMRAVAASCAVPGLYPPVTIAGRRYIDGGVRSPTNADLAAGFNAVLLVAVTLKSFAPMMEAAARRELAPLEAAGGRTLLIVPDEPSLEAFGPNLMDTARRGAIAEAGLRQGRNEAARLDAWK